MFKFLIIFLFLFVANPSQALDLSGQWQSDSGESIRIYPVENGYLAYNKINYVYGNGQATGEEIHFYWVFKKLAKDNKISGKLSSVDTHWQCEINNGDVKVQVFDNDHILLLYPQINFQRVQSYAAIDEIREVPILCNYYSPWESFEYICAWQREKVSVPNYHLRTECKVTKKKYIPIELKRIK